MRALFSLSLGKLIDERAPHPLVANFVRVALALSVVASCISLGYAAVWHFVLRDIPFIRKLAGLEGPKPRDPDRDEQAELRALRAETNRVRAERAQQCTQQSSGSASAGATQNSNDFQAADAFSDSNSTAPYSPRLGTFADTREVRTQNERNYEDAGRHRKALQSRNAPGDFERSYPSPPIMRGQTRHQPTVTFAPIPADVAEPSSLESHVSPDYFAAQQRPQYDGHSYSHGSHPHQHLSYEQSSLSLGRPQQRRVVAPSSSSSASSRPKSRSRRKKAEFVPGVVSTGDMSPSRIRRHQRHSSGSEREMFSGAHRSSDELSTTSSVSHTSQGSRYSAPAVDTYQGGGWY